MSAEHARLAAPPAMSAGGRPQAKNPGAPLTGAQSGGAYAQVKRSILTAPSATPSTGPKSAAKIKIHDNQQVEELPKIVARQEKALSQRHLAHRSPLHPQTYPQLLWIAAKAGGSPRSTVADGEKRTARVAPTPPRRAGRVDRSGRRRAAPCPTLPAVEKNIPKPLTGRLSSLAYAQVAKYIFYQTP